MGKVKREIVKIGEDTSLIFVLCEKLKNFYSK